MAYQAAEKQWPEFKMQNSEFRIGEFAATVAFCILHFGILHSGCWLFQRPGTGPKPVTTTV
jgi:hypothetical protein